MTCQSFSSVSLSPPLVLFCPAKTSRAWPLMQRAGYFCVNLLADGQHDLSDGMATKGADKFEGVELVPSKTGAPLLDGILGWVDCTIHAVHEAGDHYVVSARSRTSASATPTTRCCSPGHATASSTGRPSRAVRLRRRLRRGVRSTRISTPSRARPAARGGRRTRTGPGRSSSAGRSPPSSPSPGRCWPPPRRSRCTRPAPGRRRRPLNHRPASAAVDGNGVPSSRATVRSTASSIGGRHRGLQLASHARCS